MPYFREKFGNIGKKSIEVKVNRKWKKSHVREGIEDLSHFIFCLSTMYYHVLSDIPFALEKLNECRL